MIIRIQTERQYELDGAALATLDRIDDEMLAALRQEDEDRFRDLYGQVISLIRTEGTPVPDTYLGTSDVILPAPDTTLADARQILADYPEDLVEDGR